MNWTRVVLALDAIAKEHQDEANRRVVGKGAERYDLLAELFRSLAKALRNGLE